MNIVYLKEIDSTQTYIKQYIKTNGYKNPIAFVTQNQTNGIGSRDNSWETKVGNLFFSFVLDKKQLPKDLPLQSASIYFSYILKDILMQNNSKVFLKWPNDFYIDNKKIGGTITSMTKDLLYCGIGINLQKVNNSFGYLDIDININKLLTEYFKIIESYPLWKQIFSKFEIEFYKNNKFKTSDNILLKETTLQDDGSLLVEGKKVFSLR